MTVARLTFELLRPLRVGGAFRVSVAEGPPRAQGTRPRSDAGWKTTAAPPSGPRRCWCGMRKCRWETSPAARHPPGRRRGALAISVLYRPRGLPRSMEARRAAGDFGSGAMTVWFRMTRTVVAGEEPTPLQRLAAAADSGNGISVALDLRRYTFVNPDLTITLLRRPVGEWFALEARTLVASEGLGLADTRYWDERGVLGRGVQTLLVEPPAADPATLAAGQAS